MRATFGASLFEHPLPNMKIDRYKVALMAVTAAFAMTGCGKPDDQASSRADFEAGLAHVPGRRA